MLKEFENLDLPNNHYLKIAKQLKSNYFNDFLESINKIKKIISEKDFKVFWEDKMQLNKSKFDEKSFIQGACEIAVANYFSEKDNFKVEVQVNPKNKKDVDCQFKSKGFTYNIEVKCASFDAMEEVQNSDSFKFQTLGRLDNKDDIINILSKAIDEGLEKQGKVLKPHAELKNMDNNLKDFLISAHKKFNSESDEKEINILLIGCNDKADMQSWVGYLTASAGLFTDNSYFDQMNYNNVDLVVLTNLYYKHKDFHKKNIENSWSLKGTLNLSIINPFSSKKKLDGIINFDNEMINYNTEINEFIVPGDAPDSVKEAVRIPHFVIDYLENEQGKYLFDKKI
ncbi:hypothetical protein [Aquimarina rubra]|uniref:Uncharacterized protein n=1 Tax=Aquimarina rubra TaxID=1920033 RepID=A0ABW5LJ38_9FLAO